MIRLFSVRERAVWSSYADHDLRGFRVRSEVYVSGWVLVVKSSVVGIRAVWIRHC